MPSFSERRDESMDPPDAPADAVLQPRRKQSRLERRDADADDDDPDQVEPGLPGDDVTEQHGAQRRHCGDGDHHLESQRQAAVDGAE